MIEPINYGLALRKGWRLLVVLGVIFGVVAVLIPVSSAKPKKGAVLFHWQATAIVGAPPNSGLGDSTASVNTINYWANDFYVKVAAINAVGEDANLIKLVAGMSGSPSTVGPANNNATASTKVAAKALKNVKADIVILTAADTTPATAARLTNAFAKAVGDAVNKAYVASLTTSTAKGSQSAVPAQPTDYGVALPAYASTATRVPGTKANLGSSHKVRLLAGVVIGVALGALVVLVRELLDKRIRTSSRAESTFRYPVIVEIPGEDGNEKGASPGPSGVQVLNRPDSAEAEAYRMLRMSVLFEALAPTSADAVDAVTGWQVAQAKPYEAPEPGARQVVLVVSAGNEVSRPMTAANLGATYAEAGQRVIVVSTDDIGSGYSTAAAFDQLTSFGPTDLAVQLQPSSLPNVSRLSLRPFVTSSSQLVNRASELLGAARQLADVIIIETPSLLTVHHGEALVHAADVVLVVVECGTTTMDEARRSGDVLRRLGAPVLGIVLTNAPVPKDQRQLDAARGASRAEAPATTSSARPVPEATQA